MRLIYSVYETEIQHNSDITQNRIRDKVRIKTSTVATWDQILASGLVPTFWAPHGKTLGYGLNDWQPKHIKPLVWEADVEYLPISELNPLKKPPKVSFDGSLIEQPTFKDNKNKLTTNTAGQLFTGIIEQVPMMNYSVRVNLANDQPWMQDYLGAMNSDTVRLRGLQWKPKTLLVGQITGGDFQNLNGVTFCEYMITILANPQGWPQTVLNRGTYELQDEIEYARIDETGNPINPKKTGRKIQVKISTEEPVPLDLMGRRIINWLDNDIPLNRLVTRTFDIQRELPFKKLPLA